MNSQAASSCGKAIRKTTEELSTAHEVTQWNIDPIHTTLQFSVRHMMISNVRGEFGGITGSVQLTPGKGDVAEVAAVIDPATIDTREPDRDKHLRSADFLDVERFPEIRYASRQVETTPADRYRVVGDLTIHGVTREVILMVDRLSPIATDGWGRRRAGTSAETRIRRSDFGLTWNKTLESGGVLIGDDLAITIDLELVERDLASD